MQKLYLALALALGVLVAYLDSLPGWDDTGLIVMTMLLGGVIFGLLAARRPWLFALVIGLWLPVREIYLTHSLLFLIPFGVPFAGVYAAWGLRRLVRQAG
jgi:hypothetical protein